MRARAIVGYSALVLLSAGCDKSHPRGSNVEGSASASAASSGGEAPRSSAAVRSSVTPTPKVFAPSPAELLKRAPKVLGVALGQSKQELEATLGACETVEAGGCVYWERGVEFELAGGHVQRAIAHAEGDRSALRSAADPGTGSFRAFKGDIAGVRIGFRLAELENRLLEPTQRLRAVPNGADPPGDAAVLEYAKHGIAVELSAANEVVRIHVPIAPARSLKQDKPPGKP
ncbi:MAG: hypothetical protein AB7K71_23275 [Polyangiaceae bacterium]